MVKAAEKVIEEIIEESVDEDDNDEYDEESEESEEVSEMSEDVFDFGLPVEYLKQHHAQQYEHDELNVPGVKSKRFKFINTSNIVLPSSYISRYIRHNTVLIDDASVKSLSVINKMIGFDKHCVVYLSTGYNKLLTSLMKHHDRRQQIMFVVNFLKENQVITHDNDTFVITDSVWKNIRDGLKECNKRSRDNIMILKDCYKACVELKKAERVDNDVYCKNIVASINSTSVKNVTAKYNTLFTCENVSVELTYPISDYHVVNVKFCEPYITPLLRSNIKKSGCIITEQFIKEHKFTKFYTMIDWATHTMNGKINSLAERIENHELEFEIDDVSKCIKCCINGLFIFDITVDLEKHSTFVPRLSIETNTTTSRKGKTKQH